MDSNRTHQAVVVVTNPAPSPPAAAVVSLLLQESTGDSDESDADVWVRSASGLPSETDDDAESCSGSGGGFNGGYFLGSANQEDDENGEFEDGDRAMEVDMTEVDSKMAVPWWRRTGEFAAKDDGSGCAPAAVAGEGGMFGAGGVHAAAESNRLFWEACIAHGY